MVVGDRAELRVSGFWVTLRQSVGAYDIFADAVSEGTRLTMAAVNCDFERVLRVLFAD
jgi:hypothetical protein